MIRILEFSLCLTFFFSRVHGDNYSDGWRKPYIITSLKDQIAVANAALDTGIGFLQPNGALPQPNFGPNDTNGDPDLTQNWFDTILVPNSSLLLSQLAEFDLVVGQMKYKDRLKGYFLKNFSPTSKDMTYGLLEYGYVAARAYAAYNDSFFLNLAESIWAVGRNYTVSESQSILCPQRVVPGRTVTDPSNTSSVVGGTFAVMQNVGDLDTDILFSGSTGQFLLLSALLAEATSLNETYLKAANQSAHFLHSFASPAMGAVAFHANSCNETTPLFPGGGFSGSSHLLEGLSILISITKDESMRSIWQLILRDLVTSASEFGTGSLKENPRIDGIMRYPGDPYVIRGLAQAHKRGVLSSALSSLATSYIGVQYNALLDLATNGSNIYGADWVGPPPSQLMGVKGVNQSIAATVLVNAIGLNNESPHQPVSKTIIIASVVGSVAFLSGLFASAGVFWYRRHRKVSKGRNPEIDAFLAYPEPSREGSSSFNISEERQPGRENSSLKQSTIQPYPGRITRREHEMSTEDLVKMLNQRLQPERWNADEMPPEYPQSHVGGINARNARNVTGELSDRKRVERVVLNSGV